MNSIITSMEIANHFLIGFEATSTGGTHVWFCKSDQEPVTRL